MKLEMDWNTFYALNELKTPGPFWTIERTSKNLNTLSLWHMEEQLRCQNTGKKKILLKREERNSGKLKISQTDIDALENSV